MTFADTKTDRASERFMLVKITPAYYIRFNEFSWSPGDIYLGTFPYPIAKIQRNGVDLTRDTAVPTSYDHWYHNEATGELKFKVSGNPEETSRVFVIFFNLFYTGGVNQRTTENPEDSSTTLRDWKPRIINYPTISTNIKNILAGVFSIDDSQVTIANHDSDFQNYLTYQNSFYQKDIEFWLCLNDISTIQRIYKGKITSLSLDANTVTIRFASVFNALKQPAFMGDTADESYFRRTSASFPSCDPNRQDEPCRFVIGKYSRFKTKLVDWESRLDYETLLQATCTSYSATILTTTNRTWGLCRISSNGLQENDLGTWLSLSVGGNGISAAIYDPGVPATLDIAMGDCFIIEPIAAGTTYYGRVAAFGSIIVESQTTCAVPGGFDETTHRLVNTDAPSIVIVTPTGEVVYPYYGRDYTYLLSDTSGGNKYVSITFTDNFEANFTEIDTLSPQDYRVYFRLRPDTTSDLHGTVLQSICEDVGLSTLASTFSDANTALAINCYMSIPYFDETDYSDYLKYIEDILGSALGYLSLNNDDEIEYHLIAAPSSSDSIDDDKYLRNSLSVDIDYEDVVTRIISYNPHNSDKSVISLNKSPSVTLENPVARYLHEVNRTIRFRHVLETITDRLAAILAVRSRRVAKYMYRVATHHLDSSLGDDVQLDDAIVLGGGGTDDLKITGIQKSIDDVEIEALDLEGLT